MSIAPEHAERKVEISLRRFHLTLLNQRKKSGLTVDNEATEKLKFVKYVEVCH